MHYTRQPCVTYYVTHTAQGQSVDARSGTHHTHVRLRRQASPHAAPSLPHLLPPCASGCGSFRFERHLVRQPLSGHLCDHTLRQFSRKRVTIMLMLILLLQYMSVIIIAVAVAVVATVPIIVIKRQAPERAQPIVYR